MQKISSSSTWRRGGSLIFLDTHVVAWLYAGETQKLSPRVYELLNEGELFLPAAALLELALLHEIRRLAVSAEEVAADLGQRLGLRLSGAGHGEVARVAVSLAWTRDPFDRLIVAEATHFDAPLATKDERIRKHYGRAVW